MYNAPEKKILILGSALPNVSEAELRALCRIWEAALLPRLAPEQLRHIRRFVPEGAALSARASRLLARLLLLRGLQMLEEDVSRPGIRLDRDALGRPLLPGWIVGFSHSGRAAFCALRRRLDGFHKWKKGKPEPRYDPYPGSGWETGLGLDAEALDNFPPAARAFAGRAGMDMAARDALRRWTVKEAALKALGMGLTLDPALIYSGRNGRRAGVLRVQGQNLRWRVLVCPAHWLCLAYGGAETHPAISLHWLHAARAI
ncbi:4'-phosphopantetheinyl transferase family protein [uncultured Desulfovibrio sp.]|uniref:4'-phosphopantetheinyl transferase family protein n=1 Tax=uncultured Desulfovibrio sp. TaxID=167968 RepID=UPI0003B4F132|nr:4'-phosphopantetheinyl transferase superfamily protein [uncultured Desulfovibrio sp.]